MSTREQSRKRTKTSVLDDVRWSLHHMRSGLSFPKTTDAIATETIREVARLLAEWGEIPAIERRANLVNGRGEVGPETTIYELIGVDYSKIKARTVDRWNRRAEPIVGHPGASLDEERRTLTLLRDVFTEFGYDNAWISSRFAKLPPSFAERTEHLIATGYADLIVQCCLFDAARQATDEAIWSTYDRLYDALESVGGVTAPKMTRTAFFLTLGETIEVDPDAQHLSFRNLLHPKLALKGEPRRYARRGIGLRSDEQIEEAIRTPRAVARELIGAAKTEN